MFENMVDSWFEEYAPDYNAFVKALLNGLRRSSTPALWRRKDFLLKEFANTGLFLKGFWKEKQY